MKLLRLRSRTRRNVDLRGAAACRSRADSNGRDARSIARTPRVEGVRARPTPWVVVRRTVGSVEVEHTGETPLHSVRFALAGHGVLGLSLPRTVRPGERLRVRVKEVTGRSRAMLVLRWFEPDGTELLWPIAL